MPDLAKPVPLPDALLFMLCHPFGLLHDWNWKAAVFSALIRGLLFFFTNLHAGHASASKALVVEMAYATVAAGIAGAVTQRLRHAMPRAATGLVVWLAMPAAMLPLEAAVHHGLGTPRLRTGLIASFVFAAFATGFNWFAMSRGAFVTSEGRPFTRDLALVPRLLWHFVTPFASRSMTAADKRL